MTILEARAALPYEHQTHDGKRFSTAMSLALAERVDATPRNCWWNAYHALRRVRWVALDGAVYVAGYCVWHRFPLPFEHAWLMLRDGTIVDPTLVNLEHFDPREHTFLPTVCYGREELPRHEARVQSLMPDYNDPRWWATVSEAFHIMSLSLPNYERSMHEPQEAIAPR